ncbi:MAG: hypothetical protein HIU92_11990 [Proteobacteria bacterium]|nr:hypothetical protein [Pseudomonadota bacterium]
MKVQAIALAGAMLLAPAAFTASFAQSSGSGSDVPPSTTRSAFPGPAVKSNGTVQSTLSPTSGTGGGGMSTKSGMKAGGQDRKSKIQTSAP